jgi:Leucine-rich repeat (LRR) protein
MVPLSERAVLDAIYYGTGGIPPGGGSRTWINITGWSLPPFLGISECDSYGVTCVIDQLGQEHVSRIELSNNGLTGSLPTSLVDLPYLEVFDVSYNDIGGAIPAISGLSELADFDVHNNRLSGSIPDLTGLINLANLDVSSNRLTGSIPPLDAATNLWIFRAYKNQLTGPIPNLTALTWLYDFNVNDNDLTGTVPSLTGLLGLRYFQVGDNRIAGSLPELTGLELDVFVVSNNLLTGQLPATLSNVDNLGYFDAANNRLTGPIPALTALVYLQSFFVDHNELTGLLPAAPASLTSARLCPNHLTTTAQAGIDAAWNAATLSSPWWATPFSSNRCDELLYADFEVVQ